MAKIQNIGSVNITITDLSITALTPGSVVYKNDQDVEASDDIREFLPANNFIRVKWDKDTMITRDEFEMDDSQEAVDISAQIAVHAAKTTGVHGAGSETVGIKDKDTYLDKGGTNEVTAANAKDAVTKKHGQNDSNSSCDAAGVAAGLFGKIVAVVSGASAGGTGATEILTVAGLASGDTILFVCNSTVGATPANCIVDAFSFSSAGNLSVTWIGDPGAGAKITVCLKKA